MSERPIQRGSWLTRERMVLAGLLLFTMAVRGSVLYFMREKLRDDPDAYREIAENLLRHGEFALGKETPGTPRDQNDQPQPTAYRPPLYPVMLSNLAAADAVQVSLAKVAGLHLLFGVGTVWLTWLTARRLHIGNCKLQIANCPRGSAPAAGLTHPTASWWAEPTLRMPLVAGVIVACDPILLNQSALVMTETLATFLAILALWCLARFDSQRSWFNAALAGGAMGLAVLCRPTFLPWVACVAVGMLLVRGRIENFKLQNANFKFEWADVAWRVANCAAMLGVAALVVSPWVIRNQRVFGKPIVTTTHGGYTLYLANNQWFYEWLKGDSDVPWSNVEFELERLDDWFLQSPSRDSVELQRDALDYRCAWDMIRENRSMFVWASAYRLGQLWSPLPNRLTAEESTGRWVLRYAVAAWYCGVYLLAVVGIWRIWRKGGPPLRGRPGGGKDVAASGTEAESTGGPVLPRSGGPLLRPLWVWGLLLCVVFTGVHTFYWSNLRMRAPLMPFVALVAAAGFCGRGWPRIDADERR